MNGTYITSAPTAQLLPDLGGWPEVALVGRSNCGKSSLINSLLMQTQLARVSNTPGRTQMVNFFRVSKGEEQLIFADLPGYGFSAIGKDTRKNWQGLVEGYLARREIAELLWLGDVRRAGDLDDDDKGLLTILGRTAPLTCVLTKIDKVNQSEAAKAQAAVRKVLTELGVEGRVVGASSLNKKGVDALRNELLKHLKPVGPAPG